MNVLFVLLPLHTTIDALRLALPADLQARLRGLRFRTYPRADDAPHLVGLVRALRDPAATTWKQGLAQAVVAGAVLGTITNGVLAGCFGMFSGLLSIALPLGFGAGAFLGAFTALMTGTEAARPELRALLPQLQSGDVLCTWCGDDLDTLRQLCTFCQQRGLRVALRS